MAGGLWPSLRSLISGESVSSSPRSSLRRAAAASFRVAPAIALELLVVDMLKVEQRVVRALRGAEDRKSVV